MKGIIGKKIGMTTVFLKDGKSKPCTIVEAGPCVVTQIKSKETDGYDAVQLGFQDKKSKHSLKSETQHFSKAQTSPKKIVKEFRNYSSKVELGQSISMEIFAEGEKIDVVGQSKGKGFQGVVKRHGFSGVGSQSHGQHDRQRAPGSIGGSSYPSRVFKGMRMGGRMGNDRVKIKGLEVIKMFPEKNWLLISGCVPGAIGSTLFIQKK